MTHPAAHRAFLGFVAFMFAASCTFPDVEYDMPCSVPTSCRQSAEKCLDRGQGDRNDCLEKCKKSKDCGVCNADYETYLAQCLDQCDGCGDQNGCTDATQSCKTYLRMP
jgi:hypothetical protein